MAATLPGLRRLPALFATTFACALATQASAFDAPAAPDAPTPLDPIVITGQRLDKAGTVTVLDAAALTRQGVTDMQNMARYAPLVSVPGAASGSGNVWDGAGNTGFNIRGVEGNRVGLDLDGIELPEAAPKPDASTLNGFGVGRDYVDPETLRSVTIQSGTAPAGAGAQGLGGNVSFVTKAPEDYVSEARPTYAEQVRIEPRQRHAHARADRRRAVRRTQGAGGAGPPRRQGTRLDGQRAAQPGRLGFGRPAGQAVLDAMERSPLHGDDRRLSRRARPRIRQQAGRPLP